MKVGQQVKLTDGTMAEIRSIGKAEDVLVFAADLGKAEMQKGYYIMVRRPGKTRNERVGPVMGLPPCGKCGRATHSTAMHLEPSALEADKGAKG